MSKGKSRGRNPPPPQVNHHAIPSPQQQAAPAPQSQVVSQIIGHQGPFPLPQILKGYDDVRLGLAGQIADWTMQQTEHRQSLERIQVETNEKLAKAYIREVLIGQIFALGIALALIVAVLYLAMHDKTTAAGMLTGFGFSGMVAAFIAGRAGKQQETPKQGG